MRVLSPAGLCEKLDELGCNPNSESLRGVADQIFEREHAEHSIFLADDVDGVSRIMVAFALAHPLRLQARALAWGLYEDLGPLVEARKVQQTPGRTRDEAVNDSHRDLVNLTDDERRMLTASLLKGGRQRWKLDDVKRLVGEAVQSGYRIDWVNLEPGMKSYLVKEEVVSSNILRAPDR